MTCGFCGHEFDPGEARQGCGACPGGCHAVHCPKCNYANPLEPKLIMKIRSLFTGNDKDEGEAS